MAFSLLSSARPYPPMITNLSDVVVTSLSYNAGVFTCSVLNQGNVATPQGLSVGVAYYVDDVKVSFGFSNAQLPAGASITIGTQGANYSIPDGTHVIKAFVDDLNRFTELSEANNVLEKTITIGSSAPIVSVTSPSDGVSVAGSAITLTATASDDVGVVGVQFKMDGVNVGAEDTTAPYSTVWNSTLVADGSHTVTAVARDAAGNTTTSNSVIFTVDNVPDVSSDKWYPGHYWKRNPGETMTNSTTLNTSGLNTMFSEIRASPACRGIKWVINWGETENGNWIAIDELCKRLWAMRTETPPRKVRLMLAINMKGATSPINKLLPNDLVVATTVPNQKAGYTPYTLAYPFTTAGSAADTGSFSGYYPKLWKSIIQTRLANFFQMLANHIPPNCDGKTLDQGDILCMVSSLESAPRNSWNGYQDSTTTDGDPVGSLSAFEDGLFNMVKSMKAAFVKTPVTMSLNYSRAYIAEIIPQLHALKIGINTPNSVNAAGLIATTGNKGILQYFKDPAIYNSLLINPELQGDDFVSSIGIDARHDILGVNTVGYDRPSGLTLFNMVKAHHPHYVVWQQQIPMWNGSGKYTTQVFPDDPSYPTTGPSYTFPNIEPNFRGTFFNTNPDVNNPNDPSGGLNAVRPTNWI